MAIDRNTVWVLLYTNKHGMEVSAHSSEVAAWKAAAISVMEDLNSGRIPDAEELRNRALTYWDAKDYYCVVDLAHEYWANVSYGDTYEVRCCTIED